MEARDMMQADNYPEFAWSEARGVLFEGLDEDERDRRIDAAYEREKDEEVRNEG
jgi:hypothetical protein